MWWQNLIFWVAQHDSASAISYSVVSFFCTSPSSVSMIEVSDSNPVFCIEENGLCISLMRSSKKGGKNIQVSPQQSANVDLNYFNFLSRFDFTEWNMLPTGPETDGCCVVLETAPDLWMGIMTSAFQKTGVNYPQSQTHGGCCRLVSFNNNSTSALP